MATSAAGSAAPQDPGSNGTAAASASAGPDPGAGAAAPAASPETQSLEGGSYDVIRRRLIEQAVQLGERADQLNAKRKLTFGGSELALIANERVRTENNCVPRDIVSVGARLLFGYNVFIGMKVDTVVGDVFSLHHFAKKDDGFDLSPAPAEGEGQFLSDPGFVKEFRDLYRYTKDVRLLQLRRTEARLLAIFQIGASLRDLKVFRWGIDPAGRIAYLDSRGDEDNVAPRAHDFEWTLTTRDDHVTGEFPHISILDEVFVETVGGDLTVKIENNTKSGKGIFREPVEDPNQSLDDAEVHYAKLGALILIRVRPFREQTQRYLVFNTRVKEVHRIDAVGLACLQLPEDQGILFPGGYHLRTGDTKLFEGDNTGLEFERVIRSPNGEDVLYVFHRRDDGHYVLFPYNLIRKEIATPIHCHGYSLFDDGKMVVFRALSQEPTRVHPMQVWQTPFTTAEFAASAPTDGSYLAKVGNADLVRGISDAYTLRRLADTASPTRQTFEDIISGASKLADAYYWLNHAEAGDMATPALAIRKTAELIVDEFEKISTIKRRATEALEQAEVAQQELISRLRPEDLTTALAFMSALTELRKQRGHLITMRELRFMDLARVDALEAEVVAHFEVVSRACVEFLLGAEALKPLVDRLTALIAQVEAVKKALELAPLTKDIDAVNEGLTLLAEVVGGLAIDDATARTRILEGISEVFAQLNRARATLQARKRDLSTAEGRSEFAAQFKLFGQSVTSALALCDTPERCDEQLSRLLVQLEELEGKFGEFDEFLGDLASKREEVNDALGARRQGLLDERQRRAQNIQGAADRIVTGVARRARTFTTADDLNAYFASDAMVLKLKDLSAQLIALGDTVRADEIDSRLKAARQDATRALRDRTDLYEDGESVIKLGRHRFNVHTQPLELTLVPRRDAERGEDGLFLHLAGTDFYESIDEPTIAASRDLWDQPLVSESRAVYRGEFLALSILEAAEAGRSGLSIDMLTKAALGPGGLIEAVRAYAADRHDEGYERGVHDADAALLLERLLSLRVTSGLLRFASGPRALGCLFWAAIDDARRAILHRRAHSLGRLRAQLADPSAQEALAVELADGIAAVVKEHKLVESDADIRVAARYLVEELASERPRFTTSAAAVALVAALRAHLDRQNGRSAFEEDLRALEKLPSERLELALAWLEALVKDPAHAASRHVVKEAAVLMVTERRIDREPSAAVTDAVVHGLLGQHPRIAERAMPVRLDELLGRVSAFAHEQAPRYRAYRKLRHEILERERRRLRIDEFMPRVLTSFVRNRLIDEVYLPLIGNNLAKQIGAAGDAKRTDLMGMLLLISPPGYGKTTLMEYIASRLGLVFMKVNGPALGHEVTSIDPADAPNATARQEVEKINLGLEMGNNVMLYLDDIQHTHPELLQKFISLCDGQRRIEGVWRGRTRTYDLRGKKFCIVMAGNPYTESGAKFQIPDMLANRADTYNLGDILDGKGDLFALSYIENALTANRTLSPLAGRDQADVHKLLRMARGEDVPATELSYAYSGAEIAEIIAVLQRLFKVQSVLLKVNMQYIASASQDDSFRTEPPFKLQGSYRNMSKLAEKVVAAHSDDELERLIDDHYQGESQTLTTGAEQNLLKLAELRGRATPEQKARWEEIRKGYVRVKLMGGKDDDPVTRVTGTLSGLGKELDGIRQALGSAAAEAKKRAEVEHAAVELRRRAEAEAETRSRAQAEAKNAAASSDAAASTADIFEKLEVLVRTFSRPQLEVHLKGDVAIAELLAQQLSIVDRTMLPFARAAAQSASSAQAMEQRLAELSGLLRSLQEQLYSGVVAAATGPSPSGAGYAMGAGAGYPMAAEAAMGAPMGEAPPGGAGSLRYDAQLGASTATNFYRGVGPGEIAHRGGIFVATYRRLPERGAQVSLRVGFPGGAEFDAQAVVVWTSEPVGATTPDAAPGFGARFSELSPEASRMIEQYARQREPILYDEG